MTTEFAENFELFDNFSFLHIFAYASLYNDFGGILNNKSGADLLLWSNATLSNNGTLNNLGHLTSVGTLNSIGTLNNSGTLDNNTGSMLANYGNLYNNSGGTLNNSGTLTSEGILINSGTLYNNSGSLLNNHYMFYNNSGATLNNSGTLNNSEVVSNAGTMINSGAVTGNGTYGQSAGQTINNGSMTQTYIQINGGVLAGTGILTGDVTIGSGAIVAPGDPLGAGLGTLTINGTFTSSGSLLFDINGLGAGQFDVLDINGIATFLGGTIEFDLTGFSAVAGNYWDFFSADTLMGWDMLSFAVTGLGSGLTWEIDSIAGGGERLMILADNGGGTAVPEPSSLALLGTGMLALAAWARKRKTP